MKLVFLWLWLAVLGFAVVTAGSCSISHHSDDFACTKQAECAAGRTCTDGFCVTPVDAAVKIDAPQAACPSQCTSCSNDTKTCKIDCALDNGGCTQHLTCPTGWNCTIACSTDNSCRNGIDCTAGKSCAITCSGAQSCRNLSCGAGRCSVGCTGDASCRNVTCGLSCACDVTCNINSSCTILTCKSPDCVSPSAFGGCTSLTTGCNTCP